MKTAESMRNEKGFILVLALVVMAAMTAIGLAIITSSTTDMLIARNETEAKKAFYLAESGVQEAMGRMELVGNTDMLVGESKAQQLARLGGTPSYTSQTFTSGDPNGPGTISSSDGTGAILKGVQVPGLGGTYSVTIHYAVPGADTWCQSTTPAPGPYPSTSFTNCSVPLVMYGQNFSFAGTAVPAKGLVPVFQIDSTGTTASGTSATIREYVSESTLNVKPPAGNIFSNSSITVSGAGSVIGTASGTSVTGCSGSCSTAGWPGAADMTTYLGIPIADIPQYATPPSPYSQTGLNAVTYDTTGWGQICSTSTTGCNPYTSSCDAPHICDNPAAIIYIDNASAGNVKVLGGGTGRGILVITGNVQLDSNFTWEGLVYIMGNLTGNGNLTVFGDIMVNNTVNFTGSMAAYGSDDVAASVAEGLAVPKELRWAKR